MNTTRLRSLFVGSTWRVLLLSLGVGVVYATILVVAGFLGISPSQEVVIVVLVPLAIVITHFGGGLLPNWTVAFPFAWYSQWKGWCVGVGFCLPPRPGPIEVLPQSVMTAVVTGTFGYGFTKMTAVKHEDPPVWVTVGYFSVASILTFLLMVFLDEFGGYCVIFSC